MTEIYEHPLLVGLLDIVCPRCQGRAVFSIGHGLPLAINPRKADGTQNWGGRMRCTGCGHTAKHTLDWPAQAWFQIEYKGEILWAKDAAMLAEIRRFIAAGAERNALGKTSEWWRYLLRIPSVFLSAQAREPMLRKIDKRLA